MPSKRKRDQTALLPVTTLCGFLGAGKTTLLQHILHTKHSEKGGKKFRCAVIVNDMAELNIDKSLIDKTSLVQSDEVIAMQNGCVCCTLKNDLVDQITKLASGGKFDYMIIEASGVSEPSEIASLFADCDDKHDHDEAHGDKESLSTLARLDTCVTVVDAMEFTANLNSIKASGGKKETHAELLVEQIEYSNVVILNKTDLVDKTQLETVKEQLAHLNPRAKVLTAKHSKIDLMEVLNTSLYKAEDFKSFVRASPDISEPSCCAASRARGESPCCLRARTVSSKMSTVVLASSKIKTTRHSSRFGISSFVYKARRPFHPIRFHEGFVDKFFVFIERDLEEEEGGEEDEGEDSDYEDLLAEGAEEEGAEGSSADVWQVKFEKLRKKHIEAVTVITILKERLDKNGVNMEDLTAPVEDAMQDPLTENAEGDKKPEEDESRQKKLQSEAEEKQKIRTKRFGNLLRSKGYVWFANSHDLMGVFSQASNVVTTETPGRWSAVDSLAWKGTKEEKEKLRKDWEDPWGDRRQEIVFIGKGMDHKAVQEDLDSCLLTDEEMALGVDGWKATFGDLLLDEGEE